MKRSKSVDKLPHRSRPGKSEFDQDDARMIAVQGLNFLGADSLRLERFLALSGLSPTTLREAAAAPGFLLAVLDYIVADETLLIAFAAAGEYDPPKVARARERLAGPPPEESP